MADFIASPDGGMTEKGFEPIVKQDAPEKTAEEIAAEEAAKADAPAEVGTPQEETPDGNKPADVPAEGAPEEEDGK